MKNQENKQISAEQTIDMATLEDLECASCNKRIFEVGYVIKRISPLQSPSGKETAAPVQIFKCANCGEVPDMFLSAFAKKTII